jgi:glutathione S-transferase/GST-like protein
LSVREAGLFHYYYIDIGQLGQFSSAFLAINPDGTIPAVVHDSFVMAESTLIMECIVAAGSGRSGKHEDGRDDGSGTGPLGVSASIE